MHLPHAWFHSLEELGFVDVDPSPLAGRGFHIAGVSFLHAVAPPLGEAGLERVQGGAGEQMKLDKLVAEESQLAEEGHTGGERQAGEIYLEEFGVAGAVGGAVEEGVGVVEDVFGGEGGLTRWGGGLDGKRLGNSKF